MRSSLFSLLSPLIGAALLSGSLRANDYTAEIANGGLVARQETRVAMKKERLLISEKRIQVDYEFCNESDQDVETEVAFPWPAYEYSFSKRTYDESMLCFSVEVDGKRVPFETQAKAIGKDGRDVTALLQRYKIDIPLFAYFDWEEGSARRGHHFQWRHLDSSARRALIAEKLFDSQAPFTPRWRVELTHHWKQRFPAHQIVRITHEYAPMAGGAAIVFSPKERKIISSAMEDPPRGETLGDWGCADDAFWKAAARLLEESRAKHGKESAWPGEILSGAWVSYILTTANTWKGPIEDFELLIDRQPGDLVTFCWDGPVEKVSPTRFRAAKESFKPVKNLTIYFCSPVR